MSARSWFAGLLLTAAVLTGCAAHRFVASHRPPAPAATIAEVTARARALLAGATLVYVSDYFSFVGSDSQGHVVFALDNNRGRDGDAYQAEHFAVLHEEGVGWADVPKRVRYPNPGGELFGIPDSPVFRFEGDAAHGWTITGVTAPLTLRIGQLVTRTDEAGAATIFSMSSAPAVLAWRGRTLPGRVICEYLVLKGENPLARPLGLAEALGFRFQGLYLRVGDADDVYVHAGHAPRAALPPVLGFVVLGGRDRAVDELGFEATGHALGPGLYRWPSRWRIGWTGVTGTAGVTVRTVARTTMLNWGLGGYGMAVVRGEMEVDGRTVPVYGLAELVE